MPVLPFHEQPSPPPWRPSQLFNVYRVLVAGLFLGIQFSGLQTRYLGHSDPDLYLSTLFLYLGLGIGGLIANRLRRPAFFTQTTVLAAADILCVILLMHASGGIDSGLGVLFIPIVGAIGVLLAGIWAMFFAAVASLLLIIDQVFLFWSGLQDNHAYAPAGLTGLALFATALISTYLADRARASEALAASRGLDLANLTELSEYIVEHLDNGVIVTDRSGGIRLVNQQAWEMLGHHSRRSTLGQLSPQLLRGFRTWQREPTNRPMSISLPGREMQVRFSPLGINQEAVLLRLEDQAEIMSQVQAAKLASLGRLTASIAHEIRNPLSGITHATQLLEESAQIEEVNHRLLEIIHTQSKRIDRIIDDVLRLSRKEPPATQVIDLATWLPDRAGDIRTQLHLNAEQPHLNVVDDDLRVEFDEGHLTQILTGLCENADRYGRSSEGTLELTLAAHRMPQSRHVLLDVLDTGPGISASDLPHLFEPFFTTSATGTGLGLYLARELCALNEATLDYLPLPGSGSCFRIHLPATQPSNPLVG